MTYSAAKDFDPKAWGCTPCKPYKDATGFRNGNLIIEEFTGYKNHRGLPLWYVRCDCGNRLVIPSAYVKNNQIKHCGCKSRGKA